MQFFTVLFPRAFLREASEAENPPQTLLGMFKSACDNAGEHVALAVRELVASALPRGLAPERVAS